MISCILLSAGLSQRFGSPKALVQWGGKPSIEHIQNKLVQSQVIETIVVLGAHASEIKPHILNHKKVRCVYNKDYILGQTSSFKTGLKAISPESQGIMLLPVDYPFIQPPTIDLLVKNFIEKQPPILIPAYQNHRGHPPIFHSKLKDDLLGLEDNVGLNTFEHQKDNEIILLDVQDKGVIQTFNTAEEFEFLLKQK